MNARPTVTEEQVTEASRTFRATVQQLPPVRAVAANGDRAVCGDVGGPACMCQPSEHGGKGACGKAIAPIIVGS